MTVSILVCDDQLEARSTLLRMLRAYELRHDIKLAVELAASGKELLSLWQPERWDVVFLDIYMPGLDGVETARRLREQDRSCALIFATTSRAHGVISFDLQAMDYLTKPIRQTDVDRAMDWFLQEHGFRLRELTVRTGYEEARLRFGDIRYIESRTRLCTVYTVQGSVETRNSIEALAEEIGDDRRFLRCHQSYLVNLEYISAQEKRDFRLTDGTLIPISTARIAQAVQAYWAWRELKKEL